MISIPKSEDWAARANKVLPAGDYGNFGAPIFIKKGLGSPGVGCQRT